MTMLRAIISCLILILAPIVFSDMAIAQDARVSDSAPAPGAPLEAAAETGKSYEELVSAAQKCIIDNKLREALKFANEAIQRDDERYEAHMVVGVVLLKQGNLTGAEAAIVRARDRAPDSKKAAMEKRLQSIRQKIYEATRRRNLLELKKAAEATGSTIFMVELGDMYFLGEKAAKDEAEALKWYQKAADAGDCVAMGRIGDYSYYRLKNNNNALEWYEKAAQAGNCGVMVKLAEGYFVGHDYVLNRKDPSKAFKWYKMAAEAGDTKSMSETADRYHFGNGTGKDDKLAAAWYRRAVENGSERSKFDMYLLGRIYEDGDNGVEKDINEAIKWFEKAAELGDDNARNQAERLKNELESKRLEDEATERLKNALNGPR